MTLRERIKHSPVGLKLYRTARLGLRPSKWPDVIARNRITSVSLPEGISLIGSKVSDVAYYFPYDSRAHFNQIQLQNLSKGYHRHLKDKYSHPECHVRPGDTVIDCGGFVGGFSVAAAKMGAQRIVYVEPTPLTRRCAELNFLLHKVDQASIVGAALGDKPGKALLNISRSGADNSLLEPDEGATSEQIEVDLLTIDQIASEKALNADSAFVKIEAEGFELEIVQGMKDFRPRAIAVDVTPERGNASPRDEIEAILKGRGYSRTFHTQRCLFALRDEA